MPQYRMSWWRELKWLIAMKLIYWALVLMHNELSSEGLEAFAALGDVVDNDPRFNTVPMRARSPDA